MTTASCKKGQENANSGMASLRGSARLTKTDPICFLSPGGGQGGRGRGRRVCVGASVSRRGRRRQGTACVALRLAGCVRVSLSAPLKRALRGIASHDSACPSPARSAAPRSLRCPGARGQGRAASPGPGDPVGRNGTSGLQRPWLGARSRSVDIWGGGAREKEPASQRASAGERQRAAGTDEGLRGEDVSAWGLAGLRAPCRRGSG